MNSYPLTEPTFFANGCIVWYIKNYHLWYIPDDDEPTLTIGRDDEEETPHYQLTLKKGISATQLFRLVAAYENEILNNRCRF